MAFNGEFCQQDFSGARKRHRLTPAARLTGYIFIKIKLDVCKRPLSSLNLAGSSFVSISCELLLRKFSHPVKRPFFSLGGASDSCCCCCCWSSG